MLSKSSFFKTEYFFLIGAFLSNIGCYKRAIIYLKKSLLSPHLDTSEILYYLVKSYLKLNNQKKAKYYFNRLLDRSFNPFFIFFSYYECFRNNVDSSILVNSLKEILPDSLNIIMDRLTIALFFLLVNKPEKALKLLLPHIETFQSNYFYNIIFLKTLYLMKKYYEIIDYFNKNIEYLGSIDSLYLYSVTLYKLGLWNQCLKVLNEIRFLQKATNKPLINLGKVYLQKKNYTQAINKFKLALKRSKEYKDYIYFFLSVSYQRIGLLNDALNYILKISPDSTTYQKAIFNLALLYYDLGKFKNAKEIFYQIDKKDLPTGKYIKWKKRIMSSDIDGNKVNKLRYFIYFIPWIILIFALFVLVAFYLIVKY
ncbi:MAG: tetratricopeptide repeat protein [Spirochaetes bacterium]|nr:tetratricopeptide repeat protein [Spirochaetota bacterium]